MEDIQIVDPDWVEVWDDLLGKKVYVNVETGEQTDERPAELDGPIDV